MQRNLEDNSFEADLTSKSHQYYHNDPKPLAQLSRSRDFANNKGNEVQFHQYRDMRYNQEVVNGAKHSLNFASNQLNQEIKGRMEGSFSFSRGDSQSFYRSRTKHMSQDVTQQS